VTVRTRIVDCWWVDGDFYTEDEHGNVTCYTDAVITNFERTVVEGPCEVKSEIEFVRRGRDGL
jgi:hypothetical protein